MKKNYSINLPSENDSIEIACRLAKCLKAPLILTFSGEIGAGKTTFIRAMLRQLGVTSAIKSPTFSLVESYQCSDLLIHHFDLYRIHDDTELEYLGFRDYFADNGICCIEWPEQAAQYLNKVDVQFKFVIRGEGREMNAKALSFAGSEIMACLSGD